MNMKKVKEFLKRVFHFETSESEIKRKGAIEKGNKLEGVLISLILENPNITVLTDYRRVITSIELIRTPIYSEIDWSIVKFSIDTIEDVYSRYLDKF